MYLSGRLFSGDFGEAVRATAGEISTKELMAALSIYLVIAAVTTPIAVCVIAWIVKNEGREETVKAMLSARRGKKAPGMAGQMQGSPGQDGLEKKTPGYLLSAPLIVAVVLCLGYMSLELFL